MIEEHFHRGMVVEKWLNPGETRSFLVPGGTPVGVRLFELAFFYSAFLPAIKRNHRSFWSADYDAVDAIDLAKADLDAASVLLGDSAFVLASPRPTSADVVLFAFSSQFIHQPASSSSRIRAHIFEQCPNLVSHERRLRDLFWPDFEQVKAKPGDNVI